MTLPPSIDLIVRCCGYLSPLHAEAVMINDKRTEYTGSPPQ
jgi:hypothetical protein